MKRIHDFQKAKLEGQKISMVTCYDASSARILDKSNIDCVLIGDSLAMVMHGFETTLTATLEMMELHTAAVARTCKSKFLIADMPFLSYRKSLDSNMEAVQRLMQAGAHAVKLEGAAGNLDLIKHIVDSGVPVMGHLGLTPQSFHQLGGFKVQGKESEQKDWILQSAMELSHAGCFSIVLECVPNSLAQEITESLKIPTIGIGAGLGVDGQVLVWQDLLGMNSEFRPKFVRSFANLENDISNALNQFHSSVQEKSFPAIEESFEG